VPEARGVLEFAVVLALGFAFPGSYSRPFAQIRGEPVFGVVLAFPITGSPDHGDHPIVQSLT
jgi:hypothetical protein